MVHRLASSHEADREHARELTQDILVAIWRAWPSFRHQCSERTYVARIAHHRIATHIARSVRRPTFTALSEDIMAAEPTPEDAAIACDAKQRLSAMVRQLPIAYREVAILLLEGFTPGEVAQTLGLTPNAVAVRGTRAREMLRSLLGEQR